MVAVTWCEDVLKTIIHPPEYTLVKVHSSVSCLLQPHCCTPAWVVDPVCYVLKKRKIKDAWNEVVSVRECQTHDLSPREALVKWFVSSINPIPGLALPGGPTPLANELGAMITVAYEAAQPIPTEHKAKLFELANEGSYGFNAINVETARWLYSSHSLAEPLWLGNYGASIDGETLYNLILINSSCSSWDYCSFMALFAHELVHVNQYNLLGFEQFLQAYITEAPRGYRDPKAMELEKKAYDTQSRAKSYCVSNPPSGFIQPQDSLCDVNRLVVAKIQAAIDDLVARGEIILDDENEISYLSRKAEQELKLLVASK